MSVAFFPGQQLGSGDLTISIRDSYGALKDPSSITYSIFDTTTGYDVLMGAQDQIPHKSGTGQYWIDYMIPLDANIGSWLVRWNFREFPTSPIVQVVQEFAVVKNNVNPGGIGSGTNSPTEIVSSCESTFMRRLRILLRDNNPDRNYRFRPPNTDKFLQSQTEVFGYIWTDEELYEYLLMAVDDLNAAPPITGVGLCTMPDRWRTAVIIRAASFAAMAITMNWIADEFSVGGEEEVVLQLEGGQEVQVSLQDFHTAIYGAFLEDNKEHISSCIAMFEEEDGIHED